jgi:hypothetical protein
MRKKKALFVCAALVFAGGTVAGWGMPIPFQPVPPPPPPTAVVAAMSYVPHPIPPPPPPTGAAVAASRMGGRANLGLLDLLLHLHIPGF